MSPKLQTHIHEYRPVGIDADWSGWGLLNEIYLLLVHLRVSRSLIYLDKIMGKAVRTVAAGAGLGLLLRVVTSRRSGSQPSKRRLLVPTMLLLVILRVRQAN